MNSVTLPGSAPCVIPNLQRFLARLDRPALEAVAQAAIDQLDVIDGDADAEDGDFDMCPAGDDCGTGMRWGDPGDGLVGDLDDAEADSCSPMANACGTTSRISGTLRLSLGGRP